ncbi:hypothetical protein SNEBB_007440 [Seison nebaliae]|nr:hypothetical protein SNEBB_007440 [Seison nebaliae]
MIRFSIFFFIFPIIAFIKEIDTRRYDKDKLLFRNRQKAFSRYPNIGDVLGASSSSNSAALRQRTHVGGRKNSLDSHGRPSSYLTGNINRNVGCYYGPNVNGTKRRIPDEQRLIHHLLSDYNPAGRPVFNASTNVTVAFDLQLQQLNDMDERNQVLTVTLWFMQEWTDERLVWDPADYNGLKKLRLPCNRIWLPDIVLYNSADDFTTGYMQSRVWVNHTGHVFWGPPAKLRSSCKVDITFFPFDDQNCSMKFGSWTYDGYQVDLISKKKHPDRDQYIESGEWLLKNVIAIRHVEKYACCDEPYPDVTIYFIIRRRVLYYLFNIIFPCGWLSILALLGFWLPPDSGEKITLGITVLLAFSVFMLLIAESMPATSEYVPIVCIYLTITMSLTSMSIILTVFVLRLHYAGVAGAHPPPKSIFYFLVTYTAPAVGLHRTVRAIMDERQRQMDENISSKNKYHKSIILAEKGIKNNRLNDSSIYDNEKLYMQNEQHYSSSSNSVKQTICFPVTNLSRKKNEKKLDKKQEKKNRNRLLIDNKFSRSSNNIAPDKMLLAHHKKENEKYSNALSSCSSVTSLLALAIESEQTGSRRSKKSKRSNQKSKQAKLKISKKKDSLLTDIPSMDEQESELSKLYDDLPNNLIANNKQSLYHHHHHHHLHCHDHQNFVEEAPEEEEDDDDEQHQSKHINSQYKNNNIYFNPSKESGERRTLATSSTIPSSNLKSQFNTQYVYMANGKLFYREHQEQQQQVNRKDDTKTRSDLVRDKKFQIYPDQDPTTCDEEDERILQEYQRLWMRYDYTMHSLLQGLKDLTKKQEQTFMEKRIEVEWKLMAMIVDRVLFWIFFILTIVSTLFTLVIVPLLKDIYPTPHVHTDN